MHDGEEVFGDGEQDNLTVPGGKATWLKKTSKEPVLPRGLQFPLTAKEKAITAGLNALFDQKVLFYSCSSFNSAVNAREWGIDQALQHITATLQSPYYTGQFDKDNEEDEQKLEVCRNVAGRLFGSVHGDGNDIRNRMPHRIGIHRVALGSCLSQICYDLADALVYHDVSNDDPARCVRDGIKKLIRETQSFPYHRKYGKIDQKTAGALAEDASRRADAIAPLVLQAAYKSFAASLQQEAERDGLSDGPIR